MKKLQLRIGSLLFVAFAALFYESSYAVLPDQEPSKPKPKPAQPQASKPEPSINWGGTWEGNYRYDGDPGKGATRFILTAVVNGTQLSGKISEPNTFGNESANFLGANIDGSIEGTLVRFSKRYDGTGGQSHSVQYEGILDRASGTVRGQWAIGRRTGSFEMRLKR